MAEEFGITAEPRGEEPDSAEDGVRRGRLSPDDWLDAARQVLIRSGVNSVKVDGLARDLNVTRGSFYWHFADRADLLDRLLTSWVAHNTGPFMRVLEADRGEPVVQLLRYCEVWLDDGLFDPDFDAAVRDWARGSEAVSLVVRRADDERVAVLVTLFADLGYDHDEAIVRARTLYYHQVGYFALKIEQPLEERLALLPVYFRVLTGFPLPPGRLRAVRPPGTVPTD